MGPKSLALLACWASLLIAAPAAARERNYFIAANEVVWNYLPSGHNDLAARPPVAPLGKYLGFSFRKATYHEYTDSSFTTRKPRGRDLAYLGLLGPVIRAEVGDTVTVTFKNNTRLPLSVHVHGLFYEKSSEGAPYRDGAGNGKGPDSAVPPGNVYTYHYTVPERSGPGPNDGSSVVWMYHSHTDEVHDINTGLIGPIVVTRAGMAREDGSPKDVDREVFAGFLEMEEDQSAYLKDNIRAYARGGRIGTPQPRDFVPSMQFFSINGYLYGNLPIITMHEGERVRWYVMSGTSDFDFHTPHWHGNTVLVNGQRVDLVALSPMSMMVADMVPDDRGVWLFHCHVNLHVESGMEARYQVLPRNK